MSQTVAMSITGHETASMFRRYRIVGEADIERALVAAQVYITERAKEKQDPRAANAPKAESK